MSLSFTVTVTLDGGFKHEGEISLGQLQSLYNKIQHGNPVETMKCDFSKSLVWSIDQAYIRNNW